MNANIHPMGRCHSRRIRGHMPFQFLVTVALIAMVGHAYAGKTTSAITNSTISSGLIPGPVVAEPEPPEIFAKVSAVATDLRSPDGIARDMESGDIYVSEEDAATIVRIKPNGSRQVMFDSSTPLYEEKGYTRKQVSGLRSPEGIALDGKGTLYVVEDYPGGRLISFNFKEQVANPRSGGRVVPMPIENSKFAWEAVDIGPSGELLIAGSTIEAVQSELEKTGVLGMFKGAILYRNAQGKWWMPLNYAMESYSAVCFSSDGNYAFFACEVPGDVGCLDLRSHNVRTYRATKTFHSPEGLCALPDGSALVAEEPGKIYRLDPMADTSQLLYDNKRTIESVFWDGAHQRLLVTDDQQGTLWSLELKGGAGLNFGSSNGTIRNLLFEEQSTSAEMVPEQCPKYLAKVLRLGGYDPGQKDKGFAFRDFAKKYCLIAIDAEAELLSPDLSVEDPIKHIQFVIVAPYLMGIQEGALIWSSSGFTAIKKSGQIVKTELVQRQIIHGDLMDSRFIPMGGQKIALPMPFSARLNNDGTASIDFMGMGVTPDYLLTLNTVNPDQSVMVVMQPDRGPQQYRISLPPDQDRSYWVIAVNHKEPEVWRSMPLKP